MLRFVETLSIAVMPVLTIVDIVTAAQGYFLAAILFSLKRGHRQAHRLLGALVLCIAFVFTMSITLIPSVYTAYPFLIRLGDPVRLLMAPLLFLYVVSMTGGVVNRRSLVHFTPFVVYVLYLIPTFYIQPTDVKIRFITEYWTGKVPAYNAYLVVRSLYFFVYVLLSFGVLRQYSARIKDFYSSIEEINLRWLRNILLIMLVWWTVQFISSFGMFLGFLNMRVFNSVVGILGTVWMYALGYIAITKDTPFVYIPTFNHASPPQRPSAQQANAHALNNALDTAHTASTLHNALQPEDAPAELRRLYEVMRSEQPFLDAELTLDKLASQVGILPYKLSQLLNDYVGQSFFDFVNAYRVEAVKRKLAEPAYASAKLLSIALETGFNSKSSFNTAFKKHVGKTPSEFRHQYQQVDVSRANGTSAAA